MQTSRRTKIQEPVIKRLSKESTAEPLHVQLDRSLNVGRAVYRSNVKANESLSKQDSLKQLRKSLQVGHVGVNKVIGQARAQTQIE